MVGPLIQAVWSVAHLWNCPSKNFFLRNFAQFMFSTMPLRTDKLMDALAVIADEENMRVTLKQSGKGSLICAAASFLGGVLMGPLGLAFGGATGGIAAAYLTSGSFKSIGEIIRHELTEVQRQQLEQSVYAAFKEVTPVDLAALLPLLLADPSLKVTAARTILNFVTNELRLQIAQ